MATHPTNSKVFATAGEDMQLFIWNAQTKSVIKRKYLPAPARSVDISPDGRRVAVGFINGAFMIYSTSGNMRHIAKHQHCKEYISVVRYSPDGSKLAVGSGDNFVDIYSCAGDSYRHLKRLKGHASYISHLDWSADGEIMQTNSGDYEIMYWNTESGKQVEVPSKFISCLNNKFPLFTPQIRSTNDSVESDTEWSTYTCVLG
jgi:WD40 repeat protein